MPVAALLMGPWGRTSVSRPPPGAWRRGDLGTPWVSDCTPPADWAMKLEGAQWNIGAFGIRLRTAGVRPDSADVRETDGTWAVGGRAPAVREAGLSYANIEVVRAKPFLPGTGQGRGGGWGQTKFRPVCQGCRCLGGQEWPPPRGDPAGRRLHPSDESPGRGLNTARESRLTPMVAYGKLGPHGNIRRTRRPARESSPLRVRMEFGVPSDSPADSPRR